MTTVYIVHFTLILLKLEHATLLSLQIYSIKTHKESHVVV